MWVGGRTIDAIWFAVGSKVTEYKVATDGQEGAVCTCMAAAATHTMTHYPDSELTSFCLIILPPSAKLSGAKYQFCDSLD